MQLVSWQVVVNVDGLVQNVTIRAVCSSVVSTIAALRQLLNRVVISSVKNAENEDVIRIASQNSGTRSYVELLTGSGGSGPNVIGLFGSLTSGGGAAHRGTNFYSGVGDDSPVYRFGSFYDFDLQQHKVQLTLENASAYYVRVDSYWTGGTEVLPAGVGHTAEQMRGDCGGGADRMRTHSAELDFANYLVPGPTSPPWTPAPPWTILRIWPGAQGWSATTLACALCGFWRELGVVLYAVVRALCADGRIRLHDRSLDGGVVGRPASELGHRTRHRRDHNLLHVAVQC